jgi:uncharacterized Zn finger protein
MRRPWSEDRFPRYSPKKPPPAAGIKVKKPGTTWWGQHWIEALERVLQGDSGRLARGRTYARAGRAHDLSIENGRVEAKVTGSRAPYAIHLELPQLSDSVWQTAIAFMAEKAEFAALLLNDEMPRQIDAAFQASHASLFPKTRADLKTSCDCPDYGDPCKHIAAVHYVLGDALDRDPFLLFELRGRSRDQVLDALRALRTGTPPGPNAPRSPSLFEKPPSVAFEKLSAESYDAAPEPLPELSFSFEPPAAHGAVLRQLGAPSGWNRESPPLETLNPVVQTAAAAARRLALSEPEPAAPELAVPQPAASKPAVPKPASRSAKSKPERRAKKR